MWLNITLCRVYDLLAKSKWSKLRTAQKEKDLNKINKYIIIEISIIDFDTSRQRSCHLRANISSRGGLNLSKPRRSGSMTQCMAASWLQPTQTHNHTDSQSQRLTTACCSEAHPYRTLEKPQRNMSIMRGKWATSTTESHISEIYGTAVGKHATFWGENWLGFKEITFLCETRSTNLPLGKYS